MFRRARALVDWLVPHLPEAGCVVDVGSGTGHNAETLRRKTDCDVLQYDVADIHWVGEAPSLFSGNGETSFLPAKEIRCVLLIYVLQYPEDVESLIRRVLLSPAETIVVVQSIYKGRWGKCVFRLQEAAFGPVAFHLARLVRLIPGIRCSVKPKRYFTAEELMATLSRCGLRVCKQDSRMNRLLGTGDELLVCRRVTE